MSKIRVGIVGCGKIFPMHAYSILEIEGIELVAICDNKEAVVKSHAKKLGVNYYTDYREMFNKENLHTVHLCTPHHLHAPMAIEASNLGIHVVSETKLSRLWCVCA